MFFRELDYIYAVNIFSVISSPEVDSFWFSTLLVYDISALVEALSAIILIVLFLMQKFGTSRVSFLFSPIMGAWTFSTPLVGIYSIIHHYPGIFKALSPHYTFHFFWRKGKEGWLLLGGTVLCITGEPQHLTSVLSLG